MLRYFVLAVLVSASGVAIAGGYCKGFEDGYGEGYCYGDFGCIAPISPICPIPSASEDDTYRAGYNRGFIAGQRARGK